MTSAEFDRIWNIFDAGSIDRTPAPARHDATVLFMPLCKDPDILEVFATLLSTQELKRAEGFLTLDERARFIARRAFRRYCGLRACGASRPLSRILFEETEKGRPTLPEFPEIHFSFSSTRSGLLGAWSTTHSIGVDLVEIDERVEAIELADAFFTPKEAQVVGGPDQSRGLQNFFKFWCLKEAALKSIGEGLPFGLDAFEFELDPVPKVVRAPSAFLGRERFAAHLLDISEHCAALVAHYKQTIFPVKFEPEAARSGSQKERGE